MSHEELEVLKRGAEAFLGNAIDLLNKGEADLAMFNLEQYCQLILKYKLLVKRGSYSRTHSLRRLVRELGELDSRVLVLVNNVKNLHYIARLEEAYTASEYLPIGYEVAEVMDVAKFVLEVFKPLVETV